MSHPKYATLALFIDGEEISVGSGRATEPVFNPATGEVLAELPHATAADLDAALAAADKAFQTWSKTPAIERSVVLRKAAELVRRRTDRIATIMTLEQGKPLAESRAEVQHCAELFEWYAEEGRRVYGRVVPSRSLDLQHIVVSEPTGPCAAFTPWNFPALTPARKLAAALAAGCSIIVKASEETPGSAVELLRALAEAGLPRGVAQLVFGVPAEVSSHLIASPVIRKVSFTGSTVVGIHLMKLAADGVKKVTMELGGNAPVIVFDDADYDHAIKTLAAAKIRNAGQVCVSPGRFFIQEGIYERFVRDMTERLVAVNIASGLDASATMGPLANARRVDAMDQMLADAEQRGGKVAVGGRRMGNVGNFFSPAVVTDLNDDAILLREECFGPLVPIVPFGSDDEAYDRANAVEAGLASYAFTRSIDRARAAGRRIRAGMVGINSMAISQPETPFGGTKMSGFGSEGGLEGLQAYLNTKLITIG